MGTGTTWAREQHGHRNNIGIESTWAVDQHRHEINIGMKSTWAWQHGHGINMVGTRAREINMSLGA